MKQHEIVPTGQQETTWIHTKSTPTLSPAQLYRVTKHGEEYTRQDEEHDRTRQEDKTLAMTDG